MPEKLIPLRWLLEPVVGALFLTLWLVAQIGQDVQGTITMVFLVSAIALSRSTPSTALGMAAIGVLLDVVPQTALAANAQWPAYVALLVSGCAIASHGRTPTRWLVFSGAVLAGPIGAGILIVTDGSATSTSMLVQGSSGIAPALQFLLLALVLSIGQVTAWSLGVVIGRQRLTQKPGGTSVLVWLALAGGSGRAARGTEADDAVFVRRLGGGQLVTDIVVAAAFFLLAATGDAFQGTRVLLVLLGYSIALAVRRLSPPSALGIAWFAAIGQMLGGDGVKPENIAILAVLYATASYGDRLTRLAGLISAGLGAVVAALFLTLSHALSDLYYVAVSSRLGEAALQFLFLLVVAATVLGLSWVLGLLARTWRTARASRRAQVAAEEERRRAQQSVVVEQERNRIARDMHDVVAHSLAVVIAQADGARYARQSDPESVDEALRTISTTAREALGDVRLLLGELRHSEGSGPAPGLDDLDRLVGQVRHAGLPVVETQTGERPALGSPLQGAIYRIVQEALTNALRHGEREEGAELLLEWRPDSVMLSVKNAVMRPSATAAESSERRAAPRAGHGVPGMRERAALTGGWLSAEAVGATFTVTAYLPVQPGPRLGVPA